MSRTPKAVYAWPGLPELLRLPTWAALGVAVGFAALLNLAILSSLVWTELLPSNLRGPIWLVVVVYWTVSVVCSRRIEEREMRRPRSGVVEDPLGNAMKHYLKGDWYEAERSLEAMLLRDSRDLEARLLRATLLRHTNRYDEAARQLDLLQRLEGSEAWELEIRGERTLLRETRQDADDLSTEVEESPVETQGQVTDQTDPGLADSPSDDSRASAADAA